jgi:hypothetical protein
MNIAFSIIGKIIVHDEINALDIKTPCRHVGGHQNLSIPRLKGL